VLLSLTIAYIVKGLGKWNGQLVKARKAESLNSMRKKKIQKERRDILRKETGPKQG